MSIKNDNLPLMFLKDKITFDLNSERNRKRLYQMNQRRVFLNDISDIDVESIDINSPDLKVKSWEWNSIPQNVVLLEDKDSNDHKESHQMFNYNNDYNIANQTEIVVSDLECSFEENETIDSNTNGSTQNRAGVTKSFIVLSNNLITKAMCDKNNNTSSYILALTGGNEANIANSCTNNNYYVNDIIKEENEISNTPNKNDCCANLKGSCYNRINHRSINKKKKGKLKLISACHSPDNYNIIEYYPNKMKYLEQIKLTKKRLFQETPQSNKQKNQCDSMKNPLRKFNAFFKERYLNNTIQQQKQPSNTYNTLINTINGTSIQMRKKRDKKHLSLHKQSKTHIFESSSLLELLIKMKTIKRSKKNNQKLSLCSTFRNYVNSLNSSGNNCDKSLHKHIRCDTEVSSSQLSPTKHKLLNPFCSNTINLITSLSKLKYTSYQQYQNVLHFINQHKYNLCVLLENKESNSDKKLSMFFKGLYSFNIKDHLMKIVYSGNEKCPKIILLEKIKNYYKFDSKSKTYLAYESLNNSSLTIHKIHAISL